MSCSNDMAVKAREVRELLDKISPPYQASMTRLFVRGAFRHAEDVAYARIMLERGEHIFEIEKDLHKTYRDDIHHRCDPVYPS